MNRLEIYENKKKLWLFFSLMVILAIGFMIPIVFYAMDQSSIELYIVILSIFVVAAVVWGSVKVISRINAKLPYLIFDEESITISPYPQQHLRFSLADIDGVIPYSINGQNFIGIVLKNEEKQLEKIPPNLKRAVKINKSTGFPAFNIHLNYISRQDLPAVVERFERIGLPLGLETAN
ncbi:STM3941 family protein [Metabacillus sp. 84]|uniref:STM3941 family protein n=1 Tax=Metabacillus sp. 84 TaxID=3404705 RepID=UPI003CE67B0C